MHLASELLKPHAGLVVVCIASAETVRTALKFVHLYKLLALLPWDHGLMIFLRETEGRIKVETNYNKKRRRQKKKKKRTKI